MNFKIKWFHSAMLILFLLLNSMFVAAQLSPNAAGYVNAVSDFGADSTGLTVTTTQLQAAIDGAISQGKALFIPAGTYLIDNELIVLCNTPGAHDKPVVIAGSSVNPLKRTVILLKSGSFDDKTVPKTMIKEIAWDNTSYADTYDRIIQSIDLKIQPGNAGAIALDWRGAEGCGIFDINIDVRGGLRGMIQAPGSGASTAHVSIIGGEIGIDLSTSSLTSGGGNQPTSTFTSIKLSEQTVSAVKTDWNRGTTNFVGSEIKLNEGVTGFKNSKPNFAKYYFGGNVLLTDCKIEYKNFDLNNILFSSISDIEVSFVLNNVYVKNCNKIVTKDADISSNPMGWRHYTKLAYSTGEFDAGWASTLREKIHIDGVEISSNTYVDYTDIEATPPTSIYEQTEDVPLSLLTYHSWGEVFPSFESVGAINVANYASYIDNGDWSPAFNKAIQDAESTESHVVFVPPGQYSTYKTINLGANTKLIGVSSKISQIQGYDMANRRFDGSTDAFSDPRPIVKSPVDGDNTLADLAVLVVGPYNNEQHSPEPCVHYSLLWQSGTNSIIRNTLHDTKGSTNYRPSFVMTKLMASNWLNLKSIASPTLINGVNFSSGCDNQYFNQPLLPSRIFVETVNNNVRLMSRSISKFNVAVNDSTKPNIILDKAGQSFVLNSLKIANASWNPNGGDDVRIVAYNGALKVQEFLLPMKGLNMPRNVLQTISLNWSGITKVVISSSVMFSIDDVCINNITNDFQSIVASALTQGVDWNPSLYYDTMRDLPLSYLNNHLVKITGGVRWYNFWKHGDSWMRPTQAYVSVENNTHPVSFYHFHSQHSMNDQKLLLSNASNVSVFGIKTENSGYFIDSENSNNIRIFGHGGMTTAPRDYSHYLFNNTTNYVVESISDEVYNNDVCQYCGAGNAVLPQATIGTYDAILNISNGVKTTPANRFDRPILWQYGNPTAAYFQSWNLYNKVYVKSGTGSGAYPLGQVVRIEAAEIPCKLFSKWVGDTAIISNPFSPIASFKMPAQNVYLNAIYVDQPVYTVSVNSGIGSGTYCVGSLVSISPTVPIGKQFEKWTGDTYVLSDSTVSNNTFYMPIGKDLTLTPYFVEIAVTGDVFVDQSRPNDTGDGLSWATAKKTITGGLAVCDLMYTGSGGYTLNTAPAMFVAQGTYYEKVWPNKYNPYMLGGTTYTPYNIIPSTAVKFYGGFPAGGSDFSLRNYKTYETIIDGTNFSTAADYTLTGTDGTTKVDMALVELVYATIFDGFIVQNVTNKAINTFNGRRNAIAARPVDTRQILISNCIIRNNTIPAGANILSYASPVLIENTTSLCKKSLIYNCELYGNVALGGSWGACVYLTNGASVINCKLYNNSTVYSIYSNRPRYTNGFIQGNLIYNNTNQTSPVFHIKDAAPAASDSVMYICNNTIVNNKSTKTIQSTWDKGAIQVKLNTATWAAIRSKTLVSNNIIWGNKWQTSTSDSAQIAKGTCVWATCTNNAVQKGDISGTIEPYLNSYLTNQNNLQLDGVNSLDVRFDTPTTSIGYDATKTALFASANWKPASNSVCINAGNNNALPAENVQLYPDLSSHSRIINNTIDIGAYELIGSAATKGITTNISLMNEKGISIYASKGGITVLNASRLYIYGLDSKLVWTGDVLNNFVTIKKGLYLVKAINGNNICNAKVFVN